PPLPVIPPDVKVRWTPADCSADLQVYRDGKLAGPTAVAAAPGMVTVEALAPALPTESSVEIKASPEYSNSFSASRWVVVSDQPRFDFWAYPEFTVSEEKVVDGCYVEGIGAVGLSSESFVSTPTSLLVHANQKQSLSCNHLIAYRKIFNSCQTGA